MSTDEGLRFHAMIRTPDGGRVTRETNNRAELVRWISDRVTLGGATLEEVGIAATGPAVPAMHAALIVGQRALDRQQ
jgi:hypothetical protein